MPPSLSGDLTPFASTSSSGLADGLGRRWLAFDREEGAMLERLVVRPELAAFETLLRDRVDRLAALEDERIGRPRTLLRGSNGALAAVSEFVPGARLSEILESAAADGSAPGVDAALGFLLDVLPALCGLHAGAGLAHGTIAPARIVVTPADQVVLLDAIYGEALSHLRFSRRRLWTEFGLAVRPVSGPSRLDQESDVAQAALAGVMLLLGRPIELQDLVNGLSAVLGDVREVAQIRGSGQFAARFCRFFERSLPFFPDPPFGSADDALIEVRELAAGIGGLPQCRGALYEFVGRITLGPDVPVDDGLADVDGTGELGEDVDHTDSGHTSVVIAAEHVWDPADTAGAEIDVDALADAEPYRLDEPLDFVEPLHNAEPLRPDDLERAADIQVTLDDPGHPEHQAVAENLVRAVDTATPAPTDVTAPTAAEPAMASAEPLQEPWQSAGPADPSPSDAAALPSAEADASGARPQTPSRRTKRSRSARARKDRLRSARPKPVPIVPPGPPDQPQAKPQAGSWLVHPDRVAVFDLPPDAPPRDAPPPDAPPAPHVVRFPAPASPAPSPPPIALAPPPPRPAVVYPPTAAAPAVTPPPAAPFPIGSPAPLPAPPTPYSAPWSAPLATPAPPLPTIGTAPSPVKLKAPAPPRRATRSSPASDIYATPVPRPSVEAPPRFPWRIAAAVIGVIVVGVIAGRASMPAGRFHDGDTRAAAAALAAAAEAAPPFVPPAAPTGRLEIETQPAGARVLLNGQPAGQTPVTLDGVPAGRHTVTLVTSSGSVRRTVRVEADRTAKLDVPIFSGWVGIFAPFTIEVSTGGRVVGTTDEPRIMLGPGRHELTLTNRALGYRAVQTVDIEPGQVRTLTLDPRGSANFNATPWAEVWIDGQKAGDTPLANLKLPLGTREVTFRHPQLGERRTTITVRADAPVAVSMDMSSPSAR